MEQTLFLILYIVAGSIDCVRARQSKSRVLKPFLMPLLLAFYVTACRHAQVPVQALLIAALAASFAGDVLLMLTGRHRAFLPAGGLFFALAHVCYVPLFLAGLSVPHMFRPSLPMIAPLVAVMAGIVMVRIIFQRFHGGVRVFFIIYGAFLFSMCFAASVRVCLTGTGSSVMIFIGALVFICSDSLLAVNVSETMRGGAPERKRPVMQTYLIAQLMITVSHIYQVS
ncbi:MAG: lysoplasmalogenase [Lachnospiraceae bacterium]|nr:lysoplasmalogenase [Lachnospiraceae bacterium]